MADAPHVVEITEATYPELVILASERVPVLVDFWAEWCGPCQMQLPMLLKLADEHAGKFLLAKINTDTERALATQHNIRSIPTMKLFRNGKVVEDILGAQTESTLRTLLDRFIERESDLVREAALAAAQAGQTDHALDLLRKAAIEDPDNSRVTLDLAQMAASEGLLDEAEHVLNALPHESRESPDAKQLNAQIVFARESSDSRSTNDLEQAVAFDPSDLEARLALATRCALNEQHKAAMDQYLEVLRRDRSFKEEAASKGMLTLFELLGNQDELVNRYRRQMFNALH